MPRFYQWLRALRAADRGGKIGKDGKGLGTLPSNTAHKHLVSEGGGRTNTAAGTWKCDDL